MGSCSIRGIFTAFSGQPARLRSCYSRPPISRPSLPAAPPLKMRGSRRAANVNEPKPVCEKSAGLWTHNLESLKPAAFVLRNIDIALGIHGGANSIKELAREEKPSAAADR